MTSYTKYLKDVRKKLNTTSYPIKLQVHTYRSDLCGDPVDEEGDYLRNDFVIIEYVINDSTELDEFYQQLNHEKHQRILQY